MDLAEIQDRLDWLDTKITTTNVLRERKRLVRKLIRRAEEAEDRSLEVLGDVVDGGRIVWR